MSGTSGENFMKQADRRIYLIQRLKEERNECRNLLIPDREQDQKMLLRALMNVRMPASIDDTYLSVQDAYLKEEIREKGIVSLSDMHEMQRDIYLYRGDITTLQVDAIVNAANSGMTGCYQPCHNCIDNCIHTYAGIQLRNTCNEIMEKQRYEEPAGKAKITEAYNLPCQYIVHTVGPVVQGELTDTHRQLLRSCYESCLKAAEEKQLESIAFCCISTGVFMFPNEQAAKIAVQTVQQYKERTNSNIKVIFNVFKEEDQKIYERILGTGR